MGSMACGPNPATSDDAGSDAFVGNDVGQTDTAINNDVGQTDTFVQSDVGQNDTAFQQDAPSQTDTAIQTDVLVQSDVGQNDAAVHVHLNGGAQKGPYQPGQPVSCTKLDSAGYPTTATFNTTTDGTGMFTLIVDPGLWKCQASGFYWKEDVGKYSIASTSMYALINVTNGSAPVFINPRTNFVCERAIALIAALDDGGVGMDPDSAILQAESEINDMGFSIPPPAGLPLSTAMDLLGGDTDANREIFRVDCALMYAAQIKAGTDPTQRDPQLQVILSSGASQMATSGAFSPQFKALIAQAETVMNPQACKFYLQKFVDDNSLTGITLPDLDGVVDTDGLGVPNADDTYPSMVLVPAGSFLMGQALVLTDMPADYYIDRYEVTAIGFKACVDAAACTAPGTGFGCTWGVAGQEFSPVNCLTIPQASAYCLWAGKHLTSDAEWEKAARGTDGRAYPWGNSPSPSCVNAVAVGCSVNNYPMPVGSRVSGTSPYGARDMSGNVSERTVEGSYRGGNYIEGGGNAEFVTYFAGTDDPNVAIREWGFRCAK